MSLKDINIIIDLYDSIIFNCDSLLNVLNDEDTKAFKCGIDIKDDLIEVVEKIRDKTINVLKCGDKE